MLFLFTLQRFAKLFASFPYQAYREHHQFVYLWKQTLGILSKCSYFEDKTKQPEPHKVS